MTVVTGKGLYVSPDSVSYVGIARSLLDGQGWSPPPGLPPPGHFPPLFTLVLAGLGQLGLDPLDAARVVNVVVFGAIIALVGVVLWRCTASPGMGLAGSVLVLVAGDLLTFSASALTEPLFILLALSAMVALAAYLDSRRPGLFAVAAAVAAGAVLTRYVGVALVIAGMAVLVGFGARRRWHGAPDALVFGAVAMAPVLGWLAWAGRVRDSKGDSSVVLHLPGLDYLGQAVRPLARWVVPLVPPALGLGLAALLVAGAMVMVRRLAPAADDKPTPLAALPWLLGAFAAAYLVVLVVDRSLLDASGRLDSRFLAPLHVVAILLVVPPLARAWRVGVPAPAIAGAAAVVALLVVDAGIWIGDGLTDDGVGRRGYEARAWQESEVVAAVAAAVDREPGRPVYTNGFDAVFLLTGRPTLPLPAETNYLTGQPNPRYGEELAAVRGNGGLVAYFDAVSARKSFLPTRAELERDLGLQPLSSDEVGTLYRVGT